MKTKSLYNFGSSSACTLGLLLGLYYASQMSCIAGWDYNGGSTNLSIAESGWGGHIDEDGWDLRSEASFTGSFGPTGVSVAVDASLLAGVGVIDPNFPYSISGNISGSAKSTFTWSGAPGTSTPIGIHVHANLYGAVYADGVVWSSETMSGSAISAGTAEGFGTATAPPTSYVEAHGTTTAMGIAMTALDPVSELDYEASSSVSSVTSDGDRVVFLGGEWVWYNSRANFEVSIDEDYDTNGGESTMEAEMSVHLFVSAGAVISGTGSGSAGCEAHSDIHGTASVSVAP